MPKFKLVFFLQNMDAPKNEHGRRPNLLGGESDEMPFGHMLQMIIEFDEAEMVKRDEQDKPKIEKDSAMLREGGKAARPPISIPHGLKRSSRPR